MQDSFCLSTLYMIIEITDMLNRVGIKLDKSGRKYSVSLG